MEDISQALTRINLEQLPSQSLKIQTSNEISIYQGQLTKAGIVKATGEILKAFPKLPAQTLDLIKERFKANGFSDQRALDAVYFVIDTYKSWDKLPNVGHFVSYDKKVKLFTHSQVTENNLWQEVEAVDVGLSKPRWAMKEDVLAYKLNKWERK